MLFLAMLVYGKTVKYTVADISNVRISGAHEHTLVIPPDYPSFMQDYTASFQIDYHYEYLDEPDDEPNEENEQENDEDEDDETTFKITMKWSVSGPGAAFAEGTDTTSDSVTVVFSEGNTDNVFLTFQVDCDCTAGKGIGDSKPASFTIHSPAWDVYHSIYMYSESSRIRAPSSVGVGDSAQLEIDNWNGTECDRRQGWDIQTPPDSLFARWSLPPGFTGGGTSPTLTFTAPAAAQAGAVIGVSIDDVAPAIPANERGTRDDVPCGLPSVSLTVVEVATLLPDQGVEVDDGDDDPDTRTFVVPVSTTGNITVTATPYPSVAEANLPASWSLSGGNGNGKLQRTVDWTQTGIHELSCSCGVSTKTLKVIIFSVEIFAETVEGVVNDGTLPSLTECMEGRNITFTAKINESIPNGISKIFAFNFRRASGIPWSANVISTNNSATYTAQVGLVAESSTVQSHKFSTPIYCSVTIDSITAISQTIAIDVYELWIKHFKDTNTGKNWKVCVGDDISYEAIASADCTSWNWDMEEGMPPRVWNPTGGNSKAGTGMKIPYSVLANISNSYFGDRYGEVNVSCYDGELNHYQRYSTDMRTESTKAKVFFNPILNIDGTTPSNAKPPCWFVFWRQNDSNGTMAVPDLENFSYNHSLQAYGQSSINVNTNFVLLEVGSIASGIHYPYGLLINDTEFGGAEGIDCTAEIVRHELSHNYYSGRIQNGSIDNDPPQYGINRYGDSLPDEDEINYSCSTNDKDTYNVRVRKGQKYAAYGDGEYAALVDSHGQTGNATADWSKGGKQW